MSFAVRDGKFDVLIAAGPGVDPWPTAGVRALSVFCSDMGLSVGIFGGDNLAVQGVLPLPGTGALVLAQDVQNRIHRIHARAVVRVSATPAFPDPFPGWRSQGLIPLSTARRLRDASKAQIQWGPATVILGTGNRALRFGSSLLESLESVESRAPEVYCVELFAQWGAKRFAGWEVERRRFEMGGGRLIEGWPVKLSPKAPLVWELRIKDAQGIRVLDVARVVSAGPFRDFPGVREHPPGSFLFELEQTAAASREEDIEGWMMEEERGRWVAGKIVKALRDDLGEKREDFDRIYRRARSRLKRYVNHREAPFTPAYQGKWISASDGKQLRAFEGVPKQFQRKKLVASIECFENIPCSLCVTACPEGAIEPGRVLNETKCTSCGICVTACPSNATLMLLEKEEQSLSLLALPWRGAKSWNVGDFATLLNRRGEGLGSARVVGQSGERVNGVQVVQVEVPTHLVWEARALRRVRSSSATDEVYLASESRMASPEKKVEITLNGEKRLVRDDIPISTALFEIGQSRAEDILLCPDGSCKLCHVMVDGVKKLGCQTKIHRGMAIKLLDGEDCGESPLCPCLNISRETVVERMKHGKLRSPEAVLSVTHVGEGKCHGQLCMDSFKRVLLDLGLDASQWIDWRFPSSEWVLTRT